MTGTRYNISIPSLSTSLARIVCDFIIPIPVLTTLEERTLETSLKKESWNQQVSQKFNLVRYSYFYHKRFHS